MLVDALRRRLNDPLAHSFQLLGDDLALLDGADLAAAGATWQAALARVSPSLREEFSAEQTALQRDAHAFLRKHNRSLHARIAGYVELGRRCRFVYPWPVVAILGLEQVLGGLRRNRVYGLVGELAQRLGWRTLSTLSDGTEDILRRTNRGIFADSIPTVLYGLRVHELRQAGRRALADALLEGPLPPLMDEQCAAIARALADGLALGGEPRFSSLAALTLRHFEREQAIFTFHMGASERSAPASRPRSPLLRSVTALRSVPAPRVVRERGQRRLVHAPSPLPPGFDLRDHDARVAAFGRVFVSSITADIEDYRAALSHVLRRWGRAGERHAAATLTL